MWASYRDIDTFTHQLAAYIEQSILIKGGHMEGETVTDTLIVHTGGEQTTTSFSSPRIHTTSTHGTGCTLASAIAVGIAQGMTLEDSVIRARNYVIKAIETAPGLGHGHGPLNHGHTING